MPTLVLHGGDDRLVPPWISEPLGELETVDRRVLPEFRHEVFNEPSGLEILDQVIAWIDRRLA